MAIWIFLAILARCSLGILAAILNVYKAYKAQKREFDALSKDPKYAHQKPEKWEEDEDN